MTTTDRSDVLAVELQFFDALVAPSCEALSLILADDFTMIDVLTGSEVAKPALLDFMGSGQVTFESIEPAESHVRLYGTTAIVTGRAQIRGKFAGAPFETKSRYVHVYVNQNGRWRLASAQGTPIANP